MSTDTTVHSAIPSWILPLGKLNDGEDLQFKEFDRYEYLYKEVQDPHGEYTGRYLAFYRDTKIVGPDGEWTCIDRLLSKLYTAIKLDGFVDALTKTLETKGGYESSKPVSVVGDPFRLFATVHTTYGISMFKDESVRLAYELISGIDSSELDNAKSGLEISILNSYNGTKRINMSYNISTRIMDKNGNKINFKDYFMLSKYSSVFIHMTNHMSAILSEVEFVQTYFDKSVEMYKKYTKDIDEIAKEIRSRLSKPNKLIFDSYWESVPNEMKNLMFVLVLTSVCLNQNYTINQHLSIDVYISQLVSHISGSFFTDSLYI